MLILELYQNDFSKDLVVFDTLEEGKAFVDQIPGYTLETEDGFEVGYVNPKHLPNYMEIVFNGNIVPLSRFSFDPEENADIIWKEVSNLSEPNDKVIEGATKTMPMSLTTMKSHLISKQEKLGIIRQKTF